MRMKAMKRVLPLLLLLTLLASLCTGIGAYAENYTYTVRVYPGVNGTISGQTLFTRLNYGDSISFDTSSVSLNAAASGKYYIMGLRESGKDNYSSSCYLKNGAGVVALPPVTKDQDFVVAYGIEGAQVSLTISCVNGNTGAVLTTETYYGNAGESVLIKAPYVDGYNPERNFLHATLGQTTAGTVRYYPITTPTPTIIIEPGVNPGANAGGNTGNTNTGAGAANAGNDNTIGNNTTAGNNGYIGNLPQNIPQAVPETEDILDLDVPLAGPESSPAVSNQHPPVSAKNTSDLIPRWVMIAGAVLLLALIVLLFWYLLFYRKKKRRDEEDEEPYNDYSDF